MISLIRVSRIVTSIDRIVVTGAGREEGIEELLFDECRVSVWEDDELLEKDSGDGCTTI